MNEEIHPRTVFFILKKKVIMNTKLYLYHFKTSDKINDYLHLY